MQTEPVTDMIGQEVRIGDRIAASFRHNPHNGTTAELRTGIVLDIHKRRTCQRNGSPREKVDHLRVRWDASSQDIETKQAVEELLKRREEKTGVKQERPNGLDEEYRQRTSDIVVFLRRFIKVG